MRQHGAVLSKALGTDRMRATGHHHREDKNPTTINWPVEIISALPAVATARNYSPCTESSWCCRSTSSWDCLQQCDGGRINRAEGRQELG